MTFRGITPYLHYEDAATMLAWLERVFGFEETARYVNDEGVVCEAEMQLDGHEIWMAGHRRGYWQELGHQADQLTIIWVDDVDAQHARVVAAGVAVEPPVDKPYAVRMFSVADPQGYGWDFMKRLPTGYQPEPGGLTEIRPTT